MAEIKDIFKNGTSLTYEDFTKQCETLGIKLADLSTGNYVSKAKYDDEIKSYTSQISTLNNTIKTRDSDLEKVQKKLTEAGVEKTKLETLSSELSELRGKYETDTKEYQNKLSKQAYEFAVKEYASTQKFSSNAAKRDFINSLMTANLTMKDGNILGLSDFKTSYEKDNKDAFIIEEEKKKEDKPKPQFIIPNNAQNKIQEDKNPFQFNFVGVRSHSENK